MKKPLFWIILLWALSSCQNKSDRYKLEDIIMSDCNFSDTSAFNIDHIIAGQKAELLNSNVLTYFKEDVEDKIALLNAAKSNPKLLFPYSDYDSVVCIGYENFDLEKENFELKDRQPKFATILCSEKIEAIIALINNPNNFGYGDCATDIASANILFYYKNKQVAEILFSCTHGQLNCSPFNLLINYGLLTETANSKLDEIAPWK